MRVTLEEKAEPGFANYLAERKRLELQTAGHSCRVEACDHSA